MFDLTEPGVLYSDYPTLALGTPLASLWSYRSHAREAGRPKVASGTDGCSEYWLHSRDPLLNTMLPSTHLSIVVNFGEPWVSGRSLPAMSLVPRLAVIGPLTQSQLLRVGNRVLAVGAVLPCTLALITFGVPASQLLNRIVALDELWPRGDVQRLFECVARTPLSARVGALREEVQLRTSAAALAPTIEESMARRLTAQGGRLAIGEIAADYGLSRQRLTQRFQKSAGIPPKLFARIVRFNGLVRSLLSSDASQWVDLATATGFYDQAHMINEFRHFAGAPPMSFFRPPGAGRDSSPSQLRGRPSDWWP